MQKLATADLQRVLRQLRDDDASRPPSAGWTCRDCGIDGEYRTRDATKCAAYLGSRYERGLHGACVACDRPEDEHHYATRSCFRYLSTCSGPMMCKTCGRPEKSHIGKQKYCYGRHFFSYCCLCHAHRYQSDPLCEHCTKRWTYLREFEAAQAQDDGVEGSDIVHFLKRLQTSRYPSELDDDDVGKPIPDSWCEGRQFYRDPQSKFAEDEFVGEDAVPGCIAGLACANASTCSHLDSTHTPHACTRTWIGSHARSGFPFTWLSTVWAHHKRPWRWQL